MNFCCRLSLAVLFLLMIIVHGVLALGDEPYCFTGAFLSDYPSKEDISDFQHNYGKKPYLVMIFAGWGNFINDRVIKNIYSQDCVLFVTLEPWDALSKQGIDYDGLINGKYDAYITDFALKLKKTGKIVFLRFAHEMNGDWYPWSGIKIGKDKYIGIYRHVKDILNKNHADNVKSVFSVNWEDVPKEGNYFMSYYPGDDYVDYVGIDGYNWGNIELWSRWMSFEDIFGVRYKEIINQCDKPVLISEFSSTSKGGNKAEWIKEALTHIRNMRNIKGFILFNVDKEADWSFPPGGEPAKELKTQLKNSYFRQK